MPSAFAHAVVGGSLASVLPRGVRPAWLALVLAGLAASPDLDVVSFAFGIPYAHPLGHRGLSHSLVFAAFIAGASFPGWRRVLPAHAGLGAALTFVALASHGVLDAFTDAGLGIGLFIPIDNGRYFAPWRPILTSPLSVGAFFTARGLAVLANEALWVGVPALLFVAIAHLWHRSSGPARRVVRSRRRE